MNKVVVRNYLSSDFDSLFEIESLSFVDPWNKESLKADFENNPFARVLVATLDDAIVGFVDYYITFNTSTIAKVAVHPIYRKQGIGSILMESMINQIVNNNKALSLEEEINESFIETMTLEVRESNIPAINLYKKMGFKQIVVKHNYYKNGENALYMGKWF